VVSPRPLALSDFVRRFSAAHQVIRYPLETLNAFPAGLGAEARIGIALVDLVEARRAGVIGSPREADRAVTDGSPPAGATKTPSTARRE
jgi:hypothetical protein